MVWSTTKQSRFTFSSILSPFVLSLSKDERTPLALRQAQGERVRDAGAQIA